MTGKITYDAVNPTGVTLGKLLMIQNIEKVIERVDAEIKQCPTCKTTVKGKFPADMHGPLQYGGGLKAFVINLLVCQMVSLNRVQKLVNPYLTHTINIH